MTKGCNCVITFFNVVKCLLRFPIWRINIKIVINLATLSTFKTSVVVTVNSKDLPSYFEAFTVFSRLSAGLKDVLASLKFTRLWSSRHLLKFRAQTGSVSFVASDKNVTGC